VTGNPSRTTYLECNAQLKHIYDSLPAEKKVVVVADMTQCTGLPNGFFDIARNSATLNPKTRRMCIIVKAKSAMFLIRMAETVFKLLKLSEILSFHESLSAALYYIQRLNK